MTDFKTLHLIHNNQHVLSYHKYNYINLIVHLLETADNFKGTPCYSISKTYLK